ncbi:MAG: DUF4258 domain-containing protein [Planctomycetes bacterium]|nr:DUF4258 domain-containing protein [Planctomycetota bacterium]MBM4083513.1 DUF4258 domain-containing protein [Planctomycetota bacterium]
MKVRIHPHARQRMAERGAEETEVIATVEGGEQFPAKFGRTGFRRNFVYEQEWRGRFYRTKQLEVIAVAEGGWLVLTVVVKYF